MIHTEIKDIVSQFAYSGTPVSSKVCANGHINSTYFVDCVDENGQKHRYVLQAVNTAVFKEPDHVMENIVEVTAHIRAKLEDEGKETEQGTVNIIFTKDGHYSYTSEDGKYWRTYMFVKGNNYQFADTPNLMEKVGKAFGHFQMQLSDFDASSLYETIPNFHNTVSRIEDFKRAVSDDLAGRAVEISDDVRFILDREDKCGYIMSGIESGRFPLRVVHNDTKLNNVMMDPVTDEERCVIDLDTVMPGSVLFDFGDAIRFGASSASEDEKDLDKVFVRLEMFEGYVKGFIAGLEGALTEQEIAALPMGAYIITLEQAMRFLGDYLNGDTYYRTKYPDHNLDRARNQMKLVADMEMKMDAMNEIIKKYI